MVPPFVQHMAPTTQSNGQPTLKVIRPMTGPLSFAIAHAPL